MNLLKISSVSFLVLCSLLLAAPAFAATTTATTTAVTTPPLPAGTQKAIVIADVSVHNAKIVSQKGNIFDISFDIANGVGAQAGVKYSVSLIKETTSGQFLADEYVSPYEYSLGSNSSLTKEITYTAPANLSGDYMILIKLQNSSGLPLGLGIAGKATLTASTKTLELLPESCSLSVIGEKGSPKYTLTQGVDIASTENLLLTCTALNSSKSVVSGIPTYETHYRTTSGDVVSQIGGDVAPISFKAGENKAIALTLPKASAPQAYDVKVSLKSGEIYSNSIVAHYVLRGASATINNFSIDKDSYIKGDTAKISLLWSPSADSFPGSRLGVTALSDVTLTTTITDSNQKACITPINQVLAKISLIEISAPVLSNCSNPIATVTLKDASGNTLDQKIISFGSSIAASQSAIPSTTKNLILIIFGILVVAGLAVYFINLKKKQNETINQ